MAKANSNTQAPTRTEPMNVGPEHGGNLLAAWRGIANLFGGQAQFKYADGSVIAENFSVAVPYDPNQIISDISHRNRRLDFLEVYPWFNGEAPEPYTDAKEITAWTVQFLRGSVEDNSSRTPKYVRDATAAFKVDNNFAKKRGPKKKIFRAENLSEVSEDVLTNLDQSELEKLRATIERAMAAHASNNEGESSSNAEEVPAQEMATA